MSINKTIRINVLSLASVEKAISDIEAFQEKLKRLEEELPKELAEFGVEYAQAAYDMSIYNVLWDNSSSTPNISVTAEPIEHGYRVLANGQEVCFVEFGAGVFFNGGGAYEGELPPGIVGIGEYGFGLGKNDVWAFDDANGERQVTHGTPASNAMYYTGEEIRRRVEETARRILND